MSIVAIIVTATARANLKTLAKRLEKQDLGDGLFTVGLQPISAPLL